jgi:hypothetical protein
MSLFNRPAWAKSHKAEDNEDEEVNIFSHSGSFRDIVAEQERRKREKLERKKVKQERRSSGKHTREKEEEEDPVAKKRRITLEDGEKLLSSVGLSANVASGVDAEDDDLEVDITQPVRRSPRKNRDGHGDSLGHTKKGSSARLEVVEIDDGSDDDEPVVQHVQTREPDEESESDEEFAELKRRARLQRQERELYTRRSGASDTHARSSGAGAEDTSDYRLPTPPDEPVVQFFITSPIPNTKDLIVQRKLSQGLQDVRKAWCKKQNLPPETWPNVFFIHRTRRLYDVNTCKSIGLEVDAFGSLTMKGADGKEGVEKVHLQAVTQEIFGAILAEKDRDAKQRSGELPLEEQSDAGAADDALKPEPIIRVTLVAKGQEDLKLKLKPVCLSRICY